MWEIKKSQRDKCICMWQEAMESKWLNRLAKMLNLGLCILIWTRRPEPEPTQKYPIRNRTENLQVPFGSKYFLPERTGTEKKRLE